VHPLDNPVRSSLAGPHAGLAERRGNVLRYPADVSPFHAMPDEPAEADWADAAALAGPGGLMLMLTTRVRPPAGWQVLMAADGVQLTGAGMAAAADPGAVVLGAPDVPEMLDLASRTKPGPFLPGTRRLGTYLGIRQGGRLVAMAGERLRPGGWTEISAVCTDAECRGQGLATRLIRAVGNRIEARGEVPFLHAAASNTTAIRLYEALGFQRRRAVQFVALRPAGHPAPVGDKARAGAAG
jgi:ribosomal protein S18 acetylase RimI-like enzyme